MKIHELLAVRSLRCGLLEALSAFTGLGVLEFGPEGTTHYWSTAIRHITKEAFTSGILESDIIFGRTERYERAVRELVHSENAPENGVLLLSSCVSDIIGTDMAGIAARLQPDSPLPLIPMDKLRLDSDFTHGHRLAYDMLARSLERFGAPRSREAGTFAVLGLHPSDYRGVSDFLEIRRLLQDILGLYCCNAPDGTLALSDLGRPSFYLVLRRAALPLAERLREIYGTPYRPVLPYGLTGTEHMLRFAREKSGRNFADNGLYLTESREAKESLALLGSRLRQEGRTRVVIHAEAERAQTLCTVLRREALLQTQAVCTTQEPDVPETVLRMKTENDMLEFLRKDPPGLLLTDEVYAHALRGVCPSAIIGNPLLSQPDLSRFSPFMGLRGAVNLAETLICRTFSE